MFGYGRGGMGLPQLDELNKTLLIGGAAALLIARAFAYGTPARVALTVAATAALIFFALRLFSKDAAKTAGQNTRFLSAWVAARERALNAKDRTAGACARFADRISKVFSGFGRRGRKGASQKGGAGAEKTRDAGAESAQSGTPEYKYFSCPSCQRPLRVPKGKGRLRVTCPDCHTKFEIDS